MKSVIPSLVIAKERDATDKSVKIQFGLATKRNVLICLLVTLSAANVFAAPVVLNRPERSIACEGSVYKLALSIDGTRVVAAETMQSSALPAPVEIFSLASGKLVHRIPYPDEVDSLAISSNGSILAAGSAAHDVKLWNMDGWKLVADLPDTSEDYPLAFSKDGNLIATCRDGRTFHLWSVATHHTVKILYWPGTAGWNVWGAAFSPDGKSFAACSGEDGYVALWNLNTCRAIRYFRGSETDVQAITYSPDGAMLSIGCLDGSARVYDTRSWRIIHTFQAKGESSVFDVAFSPNGRLVALACGEPDAAALVFSVKSGKELLVCHQGRGLYRSMYTLAFAKDGSYLLTGAESPSDSGNNGEINIWPVPK
jgi:WD40 repeat protein